MKYFSLIRILPVLILSGCFLKHAPQPPKLIDQFEPSGSLCLDALTINMIKDGCTEVYVSAHEENNEITIIQCSKSVGELSASISGEFYIISADLNIEPYAYSLYPLCADLNSVIFLKER